MASAYSLPTRITFGEGTFATLRGRVKDGERVAVFASKRTFAVLDSRLTELLSGCEVLRYDKISPEPPPSELEAAASWLKKEKPDCVVAIGGGSVMDLTKAAAFCAMQVELLEYLLANMPDVPQKPIRTIAIPTTAGTGSEVTPFVVFWDHASKKKYAMAHTLLYPSEAIVDPELTYSMPPAVTAHTGMDAFTQACEAYWNKNHNPTSDAYALEAIALILSALPKAVAKGADTKARHDMMLGSLRAGQAFSNTRTAACHSISYPMTLHYGVAHGQAVGITLPDVLLLDEPVMPERAKDFCVALGAKNMTDAAEKIRAMMRASGLKTRLSELGIDKAGIEIIVKEGFTPERMGNNPYAFTADSLRAMLLTIL